MAKMVLMVKTDNHGQAGADGISPTITETQTSSGYNITITDKNGSRTIALTNGQDGEKRRYRRKW